jgi:hypothetical protein
MSVVLAFYSRTSNDFLNDGVLNGGKGIRSESNNFWIRFELADFSMDDGSGIGLLRSYNICPISVTLSRPRILWKIVSVPMAFAHEFYVVGSLTRGFGQAS